MESRAKFWIGDFSKFVYLADYVTDDTTPGVIKLTANLIRPEERGGVLAANLAAITAELRQAESLKTRITVGIDEASLGSAIGHTTRESRVVYTGLVVGETEIRDTDDYTGVTVVIQATGRTATVNAATFN